MTTQTVVKHERGDGNGNALDSDSAARTQLARLVLRRQRALSVRVALVFGVILLGLPLFNYFLPDVANAQVVGGFTFTWLFLAILFYPLTWLLSGYFIRESNRMEADSVNWRQWQDDTTTPATVTPEVQP